MLLLPFLSDFEHLFCSPLCRNLMSCLGSKAHPTRSISAFLTGTRERKPQSFAGIRASPPSLHPFGMDVRVR